MEIYKIPNNQNILVHEKKIKLDIARNCPFCKSDSHSHVNEKSEYQTNFWGDGWHTIKKRQRVAEIGKKYARRKDLLFTRYKCFSCGAEWRSDLYVDPESEV